MTLKANMKRGTLYWVTDLDADSEEEAIVAAEHLFEAQMDAPEDWAFEDFDVEGA
ncbi:MAG: hypothetical protein ACE363_00020 [Alphaproteobacteria bacterium]